MYDDMEPPFPMDEEDIHGDEEAEAEEYEVIPPKHTHAPDTLIGEQQREIALLEQEVDQSNLINEDLMMIDLQSGAEHIKESEAELDKIASPEEILKIDELKNTHGIAIAFDYLYATHLRSGMYARNATASIRQIRHTMGSIQKKMKYGKFIKTQEGEEHMGVE